MQRPPKKIRVDPADVSDVLKQTGRIIAEYGPRPAGSETCLKVSAELLKSYNDHCDRVSENWYAQHPGAFCYFPLIIALSYLSAAICFYLEAGLIYISAAFYIFGIFYFTVQFIFFGTFFDRLFRKYPGRNVIGIMTPSEAPRQRIIIGAHHDSPWVCNFLSKHQKLYSIRLLLAFLFYLYALLSSLVIAVIKIAAGDFCTFYGISAIVIGIGIVFVGPLAWYNSRRGSPGAGDNLVSSIMGIKLCELVRRHFGRLRHTEIVILSTDGEEIGMRGAQAFIRDHKDWLRKLRTYVINLDSIYRYRDLAVLKSYANGTIGLSNMLAREITDLSNRLGYPVRPKKFPFGGGGTDAAHFAKTGFEATSLIGVSTDFIRDDQYYHTADDRVDKIESRAVEALLNIIINYIALKDTAVSTERQK